MNRVGYPMQAPMTGRDDAPDVNQSQPRLIVAKTSPAGWWLMTDLKYTFDHETSVQTFDAEFEGGKTIARDGVLERRVVDLARTAPAAEARGR